MADSKINALPIQTTASPTDILVIVPSPTETKQISFADFEAALNINNLLGNLSISKIFASGTPSNTTFLRGDGVWATPSGGGGGGAVDSVNGQTGVVSLNTDDIAEGVTNQYLNSSTFTAQLAFHTTDELAQGSTNLYNQTHTGDVTGATTLTIANNAVSLAKMATMATSSFLGRITPSTGNVEVLSSTQAKVILGISGSNSGDVTLVGENYLSISTQVITANPINLSGTNVTGTLAAGRFPSLTGHVTTTAGSLATTIANGVVTNVMLAGSITAAKLVGTDIDTVGTITSGTWNGTDIAVADGGTGASTASGARTNLGLVIGTNVQAFNQNLADVAALTDPGFDALVFWDDSAGAYKQILTMVGLSISGTTLTASGAVASVTANNGSLTISPTTGAVLANVNLAHNFVWTGTHSWSTTATFNGTAAFTGAVTFTNLPTSSATPSSANEFTTVSYVSALVAGLTQPYKTACDLATTGNITLSGEQTIDGTLTSASRVLVRAQSAPAQNGIYITGAGAWTRATDYDAAAEVMLGTATFVIGGTLYAGTQWVMNSPSVVTLGTDPITFAQFGAGTVYTGTLGVIVSGSSITANLSASGAITLSGNSMQVAVDGTSIEISSNALQVKAGGISNAMLGGSIADTKLSTISTAGKVSGAALTSLSSIPGGAGVIPVDNLGTGAVGSGFRYLADDGTWQTTPTGNVIGISPTVVGNIATWTVTDGTEIEDSGWNIASGVLSYENSITIGQTTMGEYNISLTAGVGDVGQNGGDISIIAGSASSGGIGGGDINITAGAGDSSGGSINFTLGDSSGTTGTTRWNVGNNFLEYYDFANSGSYVRVRYDNIALNFGGNNDIYMPTSNGTFAVAGDGSTIAVDATTGVISMIAVISPTNGGTGQTAVVTGDLLYGSATDTWSRLAGVATGNVLISGGIATAPSWGKVGLSTHVSGTLQATNFPALTGDVTTTAGSLATSITANAVTNAKLAIMATLTLKGNATGGTATPTDLTGTQVAVFLPNFIGDAGAGGTKGLVPAPAAGDAAALKFLRADGTWATPAGGGGSPGGSNGQLQYNNSSAFGGSSAAIVNATSVSFYDNVFTIIDNITNTKGVQFQVANVSAATIRVLTIPDANGTIALTTAITAAATAVAWTTTGGLNIPDASASLRGFMSVGTQTIAGDKTFSGSTTLSNVQINTPSSTTAKWTLFATTPSVNYSGYQGGVTTTNATVTTAYVTGGLSARVYHMEAIVSGYDSTGAIGASYVLNATIGVIGGVASILGSVTVTHQGESNALLDATIDVTSNTARVRVTGLAATTLTWKVTVFLNF